jgi:hypothetical protein
VLSKISWLISTCLTNRSLRKELMRATRKHEPPDKAIEKPGQPGFRIRFVFCHRYDSSPNKGNGGPYDIQEAGGSGLVVNREMILRQA